MSGALVYQLPFCLWHWQLTQSYPFHRIQSTIQPIGAKTVRGRRAHLVMPSLPSASAACYLRSSGSTRCTAVLPTLRIFRDIGLVFATSCGLISAFAGCLFLGLFLLIPLIFRLIVPQHIKLITS